MTRGIKTIRSLQQRYEAAPARVREYFQHVPSLTRDYPLDVCLSYMFSQVELAHNMTLYCGVVKLHRAEASLARSALDAYHMTRGDFHEKFKTVFGKPIPKSTAEWIQEAERVRDKVMHGKQTSDMQKRNAIAHVIQYAEEFNAFVNSIAGFQPFGGLRGFKGRARSLDARTTRWILKGMGFTLS